MRKTTLKNSGCCKVLQPSRPVDSLAVLSLKADTPLDTQRTCSFCSNVAMRISKLIIFSVFSFACYQKWSFLLRLSLKFASPVFDLLLLPRHASPNLWPDMVWTDRLLPTRQPPPELSVMSIAYPGEHVRYVAWTRLASGRLLGIDAAGPGDPSSAGLR